MWHAVLILLISGLHLGHIIDGIPVFYHTVIESDSVLLNCTDILGGRNYWKHENNVIYLNREVFNESYRNSTSVFKNYTLYINVASIFHNGEYTCQLGNDIAVQHYVNVEGKLFFCDLEILLLLLI